MADSSNSTLIYIEEDVFGVTPTATAPKEFRFSGHSLSFTPKFIESEEIVAGAQVGDVVRVGADPKGDVNIVFAPSAHDDMLEAALRGTWTPRTVPNSTATTFTVAGSTFTITGDFDDFEVDDLIKTEGFANAGNDGRWVILTAGPTSVTVRKFSDTQPTPVTESGATVTVSLDETVHVLTNGTVKRSYTLDTDYTDVPGGAHDIYTGMVPVGLKLNAQSGQTFKGAVSFMGKGAIARSTPANGLATTAAAKDKVLNGVTNFVNFRIDGITAETFAKELSFELDNAPRGKDALGVFGFYDIGLGRFKGTGSFNVYFDSVQQLADFYAGKEFGFSATLQNDDGTKRYTIEQPRCVYNKGDATPKSADQDIMMSMGYQSMKHPTLGYTMRIVRRIANAS